MDNSINVDKAAHRIWDYHRQSILDSSTPIYGEWKVVYHEGRLYSVNNIKRHIISLVFANSLHDAVRRVKSAWEEREKKMNDQFADVGKKGTMSLNLALIVLNRLNTTERVEVDREELREAVRAVSAAAKYRIPQKPEPELYENGKCPTCGAVFEDKPMNYCGNCGQALNWK